MSAVASVGIVIAAVAVAAKILSSRGVVYRSARFGPVLGDFLYLSGLVDTDTLQQRHWNINTWTDKEVVAWKQGYLASCNAIAVAGAIFASIGLTALQLPHMDSINWAARACCACSMVLGMVSVTTATRQHQTVGMLNSALDVRLWLSRGKPTLYRDYWDVRFWLRRFGVKVHGQSFDHAATQKYAATETHRGLPLESSISALKSISLPRHLLDMAVLLFLIGFGLYVLFCWTSLNGNQHQTYRNIFIAFVITGGLYSLYDVLLTLARVMDDDKRNTEFDKNTLGGYGESEKLQELLDQLTEIQRRLANTVPKSG